VMFPKYQCQIACGIPYSGACDHWLLMVVADKLSFCNPASLYVEAKERSKEKLSGIVTPVNEEGVVVDYLGAVQFPSVPVMVILFVRILLPGVKDDFFGL
jgi:hypothetical protein